MNDTDLDRLLDTWKAPAPAQSLRDGLRARFPRSERRTFPVRLRWGLATLFASAALTAAIAQTGNSHGDFVMHAVHHIYGGLTLMVESHRAAFLRSAIRQSQPKVYIDGQPAAPPEYRGGSTVVVKIPGEGVYAVLLFRHMDLLSPFQGFSGWTKAGIFHHNIIEFEAGDKQVRIECGSSIDEDMPVFVKELK